MAQTEASSAGRLQVDGSGLTLSLAAGTVRIEAVTDSIVNVRIYRTGEKPERASWAVLPDEQGRRITVQPMSDGFATKMLRLRVGAAGTITLEDPAGRVISTDASPIAVEGRSFTLRKAMPQSESYFGLGDKTGGLDRRGQSFANWNADAFGFGSATDPIYKSIPFFLGVGGAGGSYGIFLDNSWRTWFDFGHREEDVLAFGAADGPINYYMIAGPSTAEVVRRFTDLTGKAPLPPLWSLGYQQSRYSYMSANELKSIAARLRSDRIPTDVLWLDIDWQDRNRPFTVDRRAFPDVAGMVSGLGKDGFRLVTITDLHVARAPQQDYRPYDSGVAGDQFVHRADGSVYVGEVWPGPSVFPEFTRASTRQWWGGLFRQQMADGIAGVWNDMNEPAIFGTPTKTMPPDVRHRIEGDGFTPRMATHAEVHNVYGLENTRATYEGLRTLRPDERAFVMTRASYAGGQRYAATWTGDNVASWDHLKLSVQQIINLGLSGFSWTGADVSGFTGGPSPDLLTRWYEIGAFYPVFRNHSAKGTPRVEPWLDGPQHLAIRRRFVEERYRLMPYLYALADRNARVGDPVLRPVFYDYPDALRASCDQSWTFTVGGALLVAPPPKPESPQAYDVCLPAGGWYDYWTGLPSGRPIAGVADAPIQSATQATGTVRASGDITTEVPRLDRLPVFVRAGTILPRQPLVQSTAIMPVGPLKLDVYPGDDCHGTLYADDGHTMAFRRRGFLRQEVRCARTDGRLTITFAKREGDFRPWWKQVEIVVHDWPGAVTAAQDAHRLTTTADSTARSVRFAIADPRRATSITLSGR